MLKVFEDLSLYRLGERTKRITVEGLRITSFLFEILTVVTYSTYFQRDFIPIYLMLFE